MSRNLLATTPTTSLAGDESVYVVQGGADGKTTVDQIRATTSPYAVGNITGAVTLAASNGPLQSASLTGDVTLAVPTGGAVGRKLELWLTASGASRILTLNASIKIQSESAPTLPHTLSSGLMYIVEFKHNGTNWMLYSLRGGY